jgi:hypothetical protein
MPNHLLDLDGYELRHLCALLRGRNRLAQMHRLLDLETPEGRNAWFDAKEVIGDLPGYVTDVEQAWNAAERTTSATDASPGDGPIVLQARYAMMLASIRARAKQIPPALIGGMVAKRLWRPEHGFEYVRHTADPNLRATALAQLARYLPQHLIDAAVGVAMAIPDAHERMWALVALAPRHKQPAVVWHAALEAARQIEDPERRAKAHFGLVLHAPRSLATRISAQGRAAIRMIGKPKDRRWVAASIALELRNMGRVREALMCLAGAGIAAATVASLLPWPLRIAPGWLAFGVAHDVEDLRDRVIDLLDLVCDVPEEDPSGDATEPRYHDRERPPRGGKFGLEEEKYITISITERTAHGGGALYSIPLLLYLDAAPSAAAKTLIKRADSDNAMSELFDYLATVYKFAPDGFSIDEESTEIIGRKRRRRDVMGTLMARDLTGAWVLRMSERGFSEEALAVVGIVGFVELLRTLWFGDFKTKYMASMTGETVTPDVVVVRFGRMVGRAVRAVWTRSLLMWACRLLPRSKKPVRAALAALRRVHLPWRRRRGIDALAPHLDTSTFDEALSIAGAIRAPGQRATALTTLAAVAPVHAREVILRDALADIRMTKSEARQARLLAQLARCLEDTPMLKKEAVESAWLITDPCARGVAFAALGTSCPDVRSDDELWQAVAAAQSPEDDPTRVSNLVSVASHLPEAVLRHVVESIRRVPDPKVRIDLLVAVAPDLPWDCLALGRSVALTVQSTQDRSPATLALDARRAALLAERTTHLGTREDALLALADAREIGDAEVSVAAILRLVPLVADPETRDIVLAAAESRVRLYLELHPLLSDDPRAHISRLLLAEYHGGKSLAWGSQAELLALAPNLPPELRTEALNLLVEGTLEVIGDDERESAVGQLAPRLADAGQLELALKVLGGLQRRTHGKWKPEPNWFNDVVAKAAAAALQAGNQAEIDKLIKLIAERVTDDQRRFEALVRLLPKTSAAWRDRILGECLAIVRDPVNALSAPSFLATLVPWLPDAEQTNTVSAIRKQEPVRRARLLTTILDSGHGAAALRTSVAIEVRETTAAIADPEQRAHALGSLLPHLSLDDRGDAVRDALEAGLQIPTPKKRADAILALLPSCEGALRIDACNAVMRAAKEVFSSMERIALLIDLQPYVSAEQAVQVTDAILQTIPKVANATAQIKAYVAVGEIGKAVETLAALPQEKQRAEQLVDLIPRVAVTQRDALVADLVAYAAPIEDDKARRGLLEAAVDGLLRTGDPVSATLLAGKVEEPAARAGFLTRIAPALASLPATDLESAWVNALRASARRSRTDVLTDIHALQPVMDALQPGSGEPLARAVQKVTRWW